MSNKAITWAWDMPIKGNRKLVLIALADYANEEGICWPGLNRLSQKCGLARSSIIHHINTLIKLGIVSKKMRYDDEGCRTSNAYKLNFELSSESLRSKTLSSNYGSLCPDLPPHYVQNLDCNHKEPSEEPKGKVASSNSLIIKNIFRHWQTTLGHLKAKLDKKRRATIEKAINLNYSEDDLKKAIEGCKKSSFHMGNNKDNKKYDDINLILRDAEHIERFIEYYTNPPKSENSNQDNPWQGGI